MQGKKTAEAREIVAEELRKNGLWKKKKRSRKTWQRPSARAASSSRCRNCNGSSPSINSSRRDAEKSLKELMRDAVTRGSITILPERFEQIYFDWIDNLRDWCISRQIWFGHQIPVWYKGEEIICRHREVPQGDGWAQDPDTLDTWFSSGLWPFSTLGWPEKPRTSRPISRTRSSKRATIFYSSGSRA